MSGLTLVGVSLAETAAVGLLALSITTAGLASL
jgi:hypothetical protein